jgi:anti-sigma-K factor RskA
MGSHEEFRELCAAAIAGELSSEEQARLEAHLAVCPDCRRLKKEYDIASVQGAAALAEVDECKEPPIEDSWSVEAAERAFFERLDKEESETRDVSDARDMRRSGKRFTYRPPRAGWREIWMSFAAAVILAVALGITAYRTGLKRGTDAARTFPQLSRASDLSLEAQASDAGHERAQLQAKLAEDGRTIEDLKRKLSEQIKIVNSLKTTATQTASEQSRRVDQPTASVAATNYEVELSAAQARLAELQTTVDAAIAQRDENARQAANLEARVNELAQLVRVREQALDEEEAQAAKSQQLLEHDRDIRELMGARELYMADVHDVSGRGTEKTYGRVFYTKGKSLIFYAFDLDAQPGFQNAKSFQAWGRKGPDKEQARSLGIFYEDNASKKRWVLKADDPKTLDDIDAVFVTLEPHGGSQHPSGKQLLFASLRISPNHP